MLKTIIFGLFFFLLGVAGASLYWAGLATHNPAMRSVSFLLSGVMLMVAILSAVIIRAFEEREKKLMEGINPDRQ